MKVIEIILKKELEELEVIINKVKKALKNAPEGDLRIKSRINFTEYYHKTDDVSGNGRYLRKSELGFAKALAQRDYNSRILASAQKRSRIIAAFLKKYCDTDLERVFEKTNSYRQRLIEPCILSDAQYIGKWQNTEYKSKYFPEDSPEIYTERGERVRSKSEKIIADKLNLLGIPYKYECPILLEGHIEIYPDFTILDVKNRREIYLEHFGLMDDPDYVDNAMFKLNTYERNGIFPGVNLFITHETSKVPLNSRTLDKYLKAVFGGE